MTPPLVIFQLTAIGKNPNALDESVRSVLYWVRNTPRLTFRYLVWAVIEPDGYLTSPETYNALRNDGVDVLIVPRTFETSLGARGKARALEYAAERRAELGLSAPNVWVYHQDEETSVGQDTLLGISEFVLQDRYAVGTGVILYPLDWAGTPSHIQEVTRTYDDFRVLDSMTLPGNPTTGFHGSHFLVRADIEDSVGWDSPGYTPAEDLLFEIRLRSRYGSIFGVLKGFAYEKGAFSLRDQIQQRRRWVHGVLRALGPGSDLPVVRRLTILYSALSWFSALPSVAILVASFALHYGRILEVTGIFTGFIWVSMVLAYVEGYRIHGAYLRQRVSVPRFVLYGIIGALVDVAAPWFALVTRPSPGDFIPKDRPATSARNGRRDAAPTS